MKSRPDSQGWHATLKFVSVISVILGLRLGFGSGAINSITTTISVAEAPAAVVTPKYKTVAIRDIQAAGYKVLSDNPQTPGQAAGDFGEFDPKTWQVHRFLMSKPDGGWLRIGLARPIAWIESVERNDSSQVWLEFEELGIADWATLQATAACPSIIVGEGRLVTGTFEHSSGEVLNLFISGESTPIGSTANHPFWSEDRQDFVQAGSLEPGEHLRLIDGRTTTLTRAEPIAEQLPVYNLEVDGEHVYFVGESGVLVHNAGDAYPVAGGGANVGNLHESTRARIQAFVDKHQAPVTVVGSRAGGTAGPMSDFDYLIGGNSRLRQRARRELPKGRAGGEVGPGGETGIDVFNENNVPLDSKLPHIIFSPGPGL
jgi:hypothetical protein